MKSRLAITLLFCVMSTAILSACGGSTVNSASISGVVSGIPSSTTLVLQNNAVESISVAANGAFTFTNRIASGSAYSVTVGINPVGASCSVSNASGTATESNVTNVAVTCVPNVTVGGSISGLASGNIMILQNGTDSIASAADGFFVFTKSVPIGGNYNVVVVTTPTNQNCTVVNGVGTIAAGSANIENVQITCI
ncbi:MAG: hypothetical protein V4447_15720 [Pseudomonadota bacterium]